MTVGPFVTQERTPFTLRHKIYPFRIHAKGVIQRQVPHAQIMLVHVIASLDSLFRETDHLTVTTNGFSGSHTLERHLVSARNRLTDRDF